MTYTYDPVLLNKLFLDCYLNNRKPRVRSFKLHDYLVDAWAAGFTVEQALLEAMVHGYSFCTTLPLLNRVWCHWDADYEEFLVSIDLGP